MSEDRRPYIVDADLVDQIRTLRAELAAAHAENRTLRAARDELAGALGDLTNAQLRRAAPAPGTAGDAVADLAAARRERDELRDEVERLQNDYALLASEMVYEGNSISWIASKAKRYKAALLNAWAALTECGGKCDGKTELADAIRQHLTTPPRASSTALREAWDEERAFPGLADLLPPEQPSASTSAEAGAVDGWTARWWKDGDDSLILLSHPEIGSVGVHKKPCEPGRPMLETMLYDFGVLLLTAHGEDRADG